MPSAIRTVRNPFSGAPMTVVDGALLTEGMPLAPEPTDFASLARPAFRLSPRDGLSTVPDRTRFGGDPIAIDSAWPVGRNGPLVFVGQLNFAELASVGKEALRDLPSEGMLSLFTDDVELPFGYGCGDNAIWSLRYIDDPGAAHTLTAPPGVRRFPEVALEPTAFLSFPSPDDDAIVHWASTAHRLTEEGEWLQRPGALAYQDFHRRYVEGLGGRPWHWVGGHAAWLQSDTRLVCEMTSLGISYDHEAIRREERSGSNLAGVARHLLEWELLWQIDTANGLPDWGDSGTLYVMIRRDDLRAKRFDKAWLTMSCH